MEAQINIIYTLHFCTFLESPDTQYILNISDMSVAKVETDIPMDEETNQENVQEECKAPSEDVEAAVEIKREGFTSENFKIELNNLPKFFSVGQAKKLFKNLGLQAHKFKPVGHNARYMFVNFG